MFSIKGVKLFYSNLYPINILVFCFVHLSLLCTAKYIIYQSVIKLIILTKCAV